MPLIGVIDPDGRELSWKEYLESKDFRLFPDAVRHALYKSCNQQRTRWISVTTILYCLRKARWEFERDFYLPEESLYMFMRGNLLHEILSAHKVEDALVETPISTIFPGLKIPIGGQLDRWENGILDDYKTTSDNSIHILLRLH